MDFVFDPSLVLYLPLWKLDGASFMSKDAYGHLCTVNGALWTPQGRYFDGSDDRIVVGDIGTITNFTVIAWVKWVSASNYENVFQLKYEASTQKTNLTTRDTKTVEWYGPDGTNVNLPVGTLQNGEWVMMTVSCDASALHISLDGGRLSASGGNGNTTPIVTNLYIGTGYDLSALRSINATIGDFIVYNRKITDVEDTHIYNATKWRYR